MKKPQQHAQKDRQNSTEYRVTNAEEKLLDVLLNPEYRFKNVTEICGIARIDRKTYYNAFNKPEFVAYFKKESYRLVDHNLAALINTCIWKALRGHATFTKMVLTMAGVYPGKATLPDRYGNSPLKVIFRRVGDDDDGT